MNALANVELEAEVEEVLQKLPDTVGGGCENILDRIRNRGGLKKDRAESTLAWVWYAHRPLSIHELQHALAISGTPGGDREEASEPARRDHFGLLRPPRPRFQRQGRIRSLFSSRVISSHKSRRFSRFRQARRHCLRKASVYIGDSAARGAKYLSQVQLVGGGKA